ncbi:MAG: sigma-70 family RNA polymerase sigma factor [Candidatus Izemoplasmatales bacterium]|jgi:RNA polymerase sporulation-specific sigma factor|nr:sigma-70 family RNA polymerase sigma factor [Candidatus Izemoplasmatales bacterium]MDD4595652.1 sigma-70 family RNA polymerase sigma factor [Candidatus Izemoplasmatales bacterium]
MNFRDYNDFEIIDLIKQGNEEALELMFDKYKYLVAKKIAKFNLSDEFDDCFQEGMIVLYKSVLKYDDDRKKSFMRFFETNLEHHFISIIRTRQRYFKFVREKFPVLIDYHVEEVESNQYTETDIKQAIDHLSQLELVVFVAKFINDKPVDLIAREQNVPIKKVYNAIDRIRQKIKMHLQ